MEDKYLQLIQTRYNIHGKTVREFMNNFLNLVCNQIITPGDKKIYLKKLSHNQEIINTLEQLGYYVIKNSNNEEKKKSWNAIIEIIDKFKIKLKSIKQAKDNLISFKSSKCSKEETQYIDNLLNFFNSSSYSDDVLGQLQNLIDNNRNQLEEFKASDTLVSLNKSLINELNNLNVKIPCLDSDGIVVFSNEITKYYQNYRLLINLDNLDFFMKNLKPKYSSYIISLFFSANNKYISNYLYYHLNTFSYLNKSEQLDQNPILSWKDAITTLVNSYRDIFDEYLSKISDYCNLRDITDIKYETIEYYLQEMLKIDNIVFNDLTYDVNKRIFCLLCSCFDLKLTSKFDKQTNTEYYRINSNRLINGIVNKELLVKINYNNSITFDIVNLNELNTTLISIPLFLTTNNHYKNNILLYLQELINSFSNAIFNLIHPNKFYYPSNDTKLFHIIFNKFCFLIIYERVGYLFNKTNNEERLIKKHLSIKKAFDYNNILINLVFQCNLLNEQFNKSLIRKIKKFSETIQSEKIIQQNIIELMQNIFKEVHKNIFDYTDKMNIFNPLLTFDKDYITDMKLNIYTCSIYKQFKYNIIKKKKDNIECSTIYHIMDIDDFNHYVINKQDGINMDDIIDIFFSDDYSFKEESEKDDEELMTETCYDINNVITKEIF